ncbi:MAG: 50S ribosomal protein L15 [Candidatus Aenigmarchaeota archaeon]|nr:50S ribosomal protein L15 [Candidatus Aenigmarchaeota archaeon]
MVVRRKKKVRKYRGHRTYGYGSHKKHRGKGSRGGRGFAGMHKHKWSYTVKYAKDHFGKRGFKSPQKKEIKGINLEELDKKAESLLEQKIAEKEGEKIKINVLKLGYEKVLGSGELTKPLIIEAKFFSKKAIRKIEEAGGEAVVLK